MSKKIIQIKDQTWDPWEYSQYLLGVRVKNSGFPPFLLLSKLVMQDPWSSLEGHPPGQMGKGWAAAEKPYSQLPHVRCFSAYPEVHMQ